MSDHWRIELLGGLRAMHGTRTVSRFRSRKAASLLGYLAMQPDRAHPREVLVEVLWPDSDREVGLARLSRSLWYLRRELEPTGAQPGSVLAVDRQTLGLNAATVRTDVADFERAVRQARRAGGGERLSRLQEAASLYCGELMAGHYDDWVVSEQRRLAELFHRTMTEMLASLERSGQLLPAIEHACRAVSVDPLREDMHRTLMRLYVKTGHPELALRQYGDLRGLLRRELDVAPGKDTQAVARQAKRATGTAARKAPTAAVPTALARPAAALPEGTLTFVVADAAAECAASASRDSRTACALQSALARHAVKHGGVRVADEDCLLAAFPFAEDALSFAARAYATVADSPDHPQPVCRRIAADTGRASCREGRYQGRVLESARSLLQATQPGQILCSERTAALSRLDLDPKLRLVDLGPFHLREGEAPGRVFQVVGAEKDGSAEQPPHASAEQASTLPSPLTRFFGREEELSALEELLGEGQMRQVTLTGLGGAGKSRLALEVGRRLQRRFAGAVWFVPLADVAEADHLPEAVLRRLGEPRLPHLDPVEQVARALGHRPALLIADNLEHLLPEGAELLLRLLERAPDLRCLVTSRARLGLIGEREYPVPPLPVPADWQPLEEQIACDSVRMFADFAESASPDFQLSERNAHIVADVCARLEGLPLALELAAARVGTLSLEQMLEQLRTRFELLVADDGHRPERHRSLRSALEWSYRLLPPEARRFLARLSVFRGGCTSEAAEVACDEPLALDYLVQLREVSFLHGGIHTPGSRFAMLDTVREFAAERLEAAPSETAARRHAEYFVELARQSQDALKSPDQSAWLARLDDELENIRAAVTWCLDREPEWALTAVVHLWRYWDTRGLWREGLHWVVESQRRAPSSSSSLRGWGSEVAGFLAGQLGDVRGALRHMRASVALYGEGDHPLGVASVQNRMGWALIALGQYDEATALLEATLEPFREAEHTVGTAHSLEGLGVIAAARGEYDRARVLYQESIALNLQIGHDDNRAGALRRLGSLECDVGCEEAAARLYEESLSLARQIGSTPRTARALCALGGLELRRGETSAAREQFSESLALTQELGDLESLAEAQRGLGRAALAQRDLAAARTHLEEALRLQQETGYRRAAAETLEALAELAVAEGDAPAAARHLGAAEALRQLLGAPLPVCLREEYERRVESLRRELGESGFAEAWDEGRDASP